MSRSPYQPYAAAAARAALAAGALLAKHVGKPKTVHTKRSAIDLVTEIDRASERLIRTMLHRAYPRIGFFGEESGHHQKEAFYRWIVDPLDGTNNFVHGLPLFGVSIGLEHRGTIPPPGGGRPSRPGSRSDPASGLPPGGGTMLVGVIYDPMRRELFIALKGGGAFLNGRRIRVSSTTRVSHSLLSTGFSSNFLTHAQPYLRWFQAFQRRSHGVRRLGSTVFSLASIAAGRMEGFYERDLWPWDVAAGILLVTEAGGRASNFEGHPPALDDGRLVASNGHIHRALLRILAKTASPR